MSSGCVPPKKVSYQNEIIHANALNKYARKIHETVEKPAKKCMIMFASTAYKVTKTKWIPDHCRLNSEESA